MKSYYARPRNKAVSVALMVLLLLFSMAALLAPYLRDFIGDDYVQLWRIRDFVAAPKNAIEIFSPFWTNWYYRPLQNLWFLVNRLIFGLLPPGYYFLQIYCHLIAISLVFLIARSLKLGRWIALAVAALFALNGQHQLTVGWISSSGNVLGTMFALAAFAAYLGYLRYPNRQRYLPLTVLFTLFAMLAHEVGIVLPFFLIGLRLLWPMSIRMSRSEKVSAAVIVSLTLLYTIIQTIRPNANLAVDDDFLSSLPAAFTPVQIGQFASAIFTRWFPYSFTIDPSSFPAPIASWLFVIIILALTLLLFIRGNLATRTGLLWMGLHLGFIFLVLWNHRPELFNSRHLYGAWVGLCILIGGLLYPLCETIGCKTLTFSRRIVYLAGTVTLLLMIIIPQYGIIRSEQEALLGHVKLVEESRHQLEKILPNPGSDNRLFATRFILTPPYLPAVASVWFGISDLAGGGLETLKTRQDVNYQDYVFDYEDGVLYNLMPELQQSKKTIFLWREEPVSTNLLYERKSRSLSNHEFEQDKVLKGPGGNRFGIALQPVEAGWASLQYAVNIPIDSQLAFGIFPRSGQRYRVRAVEEDGKSRFLYSLDAPSESTDWIDIYLTLMDYEGQDVDFYFEYQVDPSLETLGFWANPRLVTN